MADLPETHETTELASTTGNLEELLGNLTRAWQDEAISAAGGLGAVVRTSSLNLLIFSADAEAAAHAEQLMPRLTSSHPCRAIHIQALPGPDAPLTATTHVHACEEKGVRTITCEQVTLKAGTAALDTLEGVIAPLLSPDLPVILWWRGNPPFEGRLFDRLMQAADRVIYDSAYFLESEEDLPWALDLIDRNAEVDVAFTDVNWARLTPWRALIAQFFDGAANLRALQGIDRVTVEYGDPNVDDRHVASQAWLVVGWLASRLQWKPTDRVPAGAEPIFTLQGPRETVTVQMKRCHSDGPRGVRAVELAGTSPREGTYRVELLEDQGCARTVTTLEGVPPLERVVKSDSEAHGELIAAEVEMPGRDQVYEEALRCATALQPR